jgi:hypothetical protein
VAVGCNSAGAVLIVVAGVGAIGAIVGATAGTEVGIEGCKTGATAYTEISAERRIIGGRGIAGGFGIACGLVAYALILASISAYAASILAFILGRRLRSGVIKTEVIMYLLRSGLAWLTLSWLYSCCSSSSRTFINVPYILRFLLWVGTHTLPQRKQMRKDCKVVGLSLLNVLVVKPLNSMRKRSYKAVSLIASVL